MVPALVLRTAGATDIGRRRKHNEDVVLVRDDLGLYLVADGAGGHNAGEVASALAARSMSNYFGGTIRATHLQPEYDRFGIPSGARRLSSAVLKANRDVVEISRTHERHQGMGTTIVAACFSPRSGLLHIAHVGDSRCYRLRGGHLELLTQDHSLLTDVLEQRPELDDTVMAKLPKNAVTRALGMDAQLRVSVRSYAVVEHDRYLLCSDGLSGPVQASELARILASDAPAESITQELINTANARGGPDNIAAVVILCQGGHAHAMPADSVPPPPEEPQTEHDHYESDPELLIIGIEDMDINKMTSASDDLLKSVSDLIGPKE